MLIIENDFRSPTNKHEKKNQETTVDIYISYSNLLKTIEQKILNWK